MDSIKSKTSTVFLHYAIPSVLGMLAISSANIVDGFFVGNYIGASGLAAINITIPVFSLMFGIALMISIGCSVVSGKLMAEGNASSVSNIFSKTFFSMVFIGASSCYIIFINIQNMLSFYDLPDDLHSLVSIYLSTILFFLPFLMVGLVLDYFVKIDNRPSLAFGALLLSAVMNIVLDWFLIVFLDQGIWGAALATGISQFALIIVLLPHFFSKKSTIKFVRPVGSWIKIIKATGNGASEFVNEISIGITTLIFNFIMLQRFGVDGIAAFTVINYILWIAIMISFGISDSLQPLISKNYGAKEPQRIEQFLKFSFFSVSVVGLLIISMIVLTPEWVINLFLEQKDEKSIEITAIFLLLLWPAFLFNGLNMVISAYFTAIHKPLPSAMIAASRSLLLPVLFVTALPLLIDDKGIYIAIPLAEFLTLMMAIYFFKNNSPKSIISSS